MRRKTESKRLYFTMESSMTAILRDASGKMHHGILFVSFLYYNATEKKNAYLFTCISNYLFVLIYNNIKMRIKNINDHASPMRWAR